MVKYMRDRELLYIGEKSRDLVDDRHVDQRAFFYAKDFISFCG